MSAHFCIEEQVTGNCGLEVYECVNAVKSLVVDRDGGWGFDVLTHDICLPNANVEGDLLASI